jgi:uncharacterized protein (TIGR02757 family)
LTKEDLFLFLETKYRQYNRPEFIKTDPVSVPHGFSQREDIEIAGFLTAVISWGNRSSIIADANRMFSMMGCPPYEFLLKANDRDLEIFRAFYHRTFNGEDCIFFLRSLQHIYKNLGGLQGAFGNINETGIKESISRFRRIFLELKHFPRLEKHLADPSKGASAKRILMFLRWMVRNDGLGVDFGLWKNVSSASLMCPLDIHSGNVSRKLGLLQRKANDWKAVEELTDNLRQFDPRDPVKYDFALFGIGALEGIR